LHAVAPVTARVVCSPTLVVRPARKPLDDPPREERSRDSLLRFGEAAPRERLRLDESVEIDPGEIILLSATTTLTDFLLLTGDKRCLQAVAGCPDCAHIAQRIKGRVVCFEQIIRRIIDVIGFESVKAKVVPTLQSCDKALLAAFGSGVNTTQINACDCLQSYIDEIRGYPIDLLMDGH
jgi:hypothetical protein